MTISDGGDRNSPTPSMQVEASTSTEMNVISMENGRNFYEKLIIVFTGLAGSTKTCQLARLGMIGRACWDVDVYSDTPIGGYIMGKYYEVEPLPEDALVSYASGIKPGSLLVIDELQEFFDRQDWYAVRSKMGVSMTMQIRKLGLTIVGAIQFLHYLNPRINDQMDILVRCIDLFFTPWGKQNQVQKGVEARLDYYDLSGGITGKSARSDRNPHFVSGDPYKSELVYAKAYWEYFATHRLTALEQRFKTYRIKKERIDLEISGNGVLERRNNGGSGNRKEVNAELTTAIMKIMANQDKIQAEEMAKMLHTAGFDFTPARLGGIVKDMKEIKAIRSTGGRTFYVRNEDHE